MASLTTNRAVLQFVDESATLTGADQVVWIDGSEAQLEGLRQQAMETGELIRLNEQGVVYTRQSLGMGASPYDANCALAALPDGSLAVVQNVQPDGEDWYTDVRLTVIPAK